MTTSDTSIRIENISRLVTRYISRYTVDYTVMQMRLSNDRGPTRFADRKQNALYAIKYDTINGSHPTVTIRNHAITRLFTRRSKVEAEVYN